MTGCAGAASFEAASQMAEVLTFVQMMGEGATVGSVIPTLGAIIPAAVGVDIGCGMIAVRTQWSEDQVRARGSLVPLREAIEAAVPLSAGVHNRSLTATATARSPTSRLGRSAPGSTRRATLGTGACSSARWARGTTSSRSPSTRPAVCGCSCTPGSRGVGNKIAQHHIAAAADRCRCWWISLPDPDLAYLVEGTGEFWASIRQLRWAQHFALMNREEMMDRVVAAIAEHMGEDVVEAERINCHHNFTEQERHFGKEVCAYPARARSRRTGDAPASSRGRWARPRTSSWGRVTGSR